MESSTANYEVLIVKREDGATRVVFPQSVEERIPWFRESVTRVLRLPVYDWPDSLHLIPEDQAPAEHHVPTVILPNWLFDRADKAQLRPRSLFRRFWAFLAGSLTGLSPVEGMVFDFAYLFSHSVPLRDDDDGSTRAELNEKIAGGTCFGATHGHPALTFLRRARIILGCCALAPLAPVALLAFWLRLRLRLGHVPLLYMLADVEKELGRRDRLRAIREKLLAAGEPPERLTKYVLPPKLSVLEKPSCGKAKDDECPG